MSFGSKGGGSSTPADPLKVRPDPNVGKIDMKGVAPTAGYINRVNENPVSVALLSDAEAAEQRRKAAGEAMIG